MMLSKHGCDRLLIVLPSTGCHFPWHPVSEHSLRATALVLQGLLSPAQLPKGTADFPPSRRGLTVCGYLSLSIGSYQPPLMVTFGDRWVWPLFLEITLLKNG